MDSPTSSCCSTPDMICSYCLLPADMFTEGWGLRDGGTAMLCDKCGSAYEEKRFCDLFHLTASGWRDCSSCKKPIHCGCVVSEDLYIMLDSGGIKCLECAEHEDAVEDQNQVMTDLAESTKSPDGPSEVNLSPQVFGHQVGTRETVDFAPARFEPPSVNPLHPTHLNMFAPPPRTAETFPFRESSSSVRVFEKLLTAKDFDPKRGFLVLPKKCAERYFPKLSLGTSVYVHVQDVRGVYWEMILCSRVKSKRVEYCLEGFGAFLSLMQCKCGDRVILHHLESSGRFVIGLERSRA